MNDYCEVWDNGVIKFRGYIKAYLSGGDVSQRVIVQDDQTGFLRQCYVDDVRIVCMSINTGPA